MTACFLPIFGFKEEMTKRFRMIELGMNVRFKGRMPIKKFCPLGNEREIAAKNREHIEFVVAQWQHKEVRLR